MSKLPVVSGQACVKALTRVGFTVRRQTGSHIILQRRQPFAQVVVPNHREVAVGTLRSILREAELSVEEFIKLL